MINVRLQVRRAVAGDQHQIANLFLYEADSHRHLDWRAPLDWLGFPNYWVLEDQGRLLAVLACPADPPHVAWIRIFGHTPQVSGPEAWSALWETARAEISYSTEKMQVATIIVKPWFQKLILSSGFELKQNIVLLQRTRSDLPCLPQTTGIRIRPMAPEDLPAVTAIDLAAFGGFWHNTLESLQRARTQSVSAMVAEDDSGLIGYQLSTGNPLGAHLARLAVRPEAQGQGVGAALVGNLLQQLGESHWTRLSVNTQSDNAASLALYQKMGFVRTGEYFPVFVYPAAMRLP
ncbi:MAG: GNAT family N-acetyltransferase [Chloroflexi bacterium]|nr:GNAT family N-acetyltransferase [Chloroflexota bacterium]